PDTLGPVAPPGVTQDDWDRIVQTAQDRFRENISTHPDPRQGSEYVVTTTLQQALKHNDDPTPNHGCEVAIRFSSSSNPASLMAPSEMKTYLSDPSMPFYQILAEWDEIDPNGGLQVEEGGKRATRQAILRVRRRRDESWSTVSFDLVLEENCWMIERLWVGEVSQGEGRWGGGEGGQGRDGGGGRRSRLDELLLDKGGPDTTCCTFSDHRPEDLVSWLYPEPQGSFSPKLVALNCLCALRANDIPSRNHGCALTARFCSPTNVASTLTPSHFAQ
ncbi:unnamed protein product, partial [Discosporangium mesarthrocarpum]